MITKTVMSIVIVALMSGYSGQQNQAKAGEKARVDALDSVFNDLVSGVADDSLIYIRNGDLCEGKSKMQKILLLDSIRKGLTFAKVEGLIGNVELATIYKRENGYSSFVSEYHCEQDLFAPIDWITNRGLVGLSVGAQTTIIENGISRVVEQRDANLDKPEGRGIRIMEFKPNGFQVTILGFCESDSIVFTPKMILWNQSEFDKYGIGGYMDGVQYSYLFDEQGRFVKYQWDVEDGGSERVYEYADNEIVPVRCKDHASWFDGSNEDIEYLYSDYKFDDKGNWIERTVRETTINMVFVNVGEELETTENVIQYQEERVIKYLN